MTIPSQYAAWTDAATRHLHSALDTARDELERDRDFLEEYLRPPIEFSPPPGPQRDACTAEAMRRFLAHLIDLQEG